MGVNIPVVLVSPRCVASKWLELLPESMGSPQGAKPWLFATIGVVCYACIALLYGTSLKHGSSMNNALWQSVALTISLVGGFSKID